MDKKYICEFCKKIITDKKIKPSESGKVVCKECVKRELNIAWKNYQSEKK